MDSPRTSSSVSLMSIPDILIDRLSCIKCKNILSVYPIHSLPDGGGICGRCIDLKQPEGIRNNLYEILLECVTFPCMNKMFGCMEVRTGKNMKTHEMKCPHRRVNCPTFKTSSCDWIGEIDNLLEHFENKHATSLLREPSFEVNFVHNYDEVCLMPYADSLFLLKRHGDIKTEQFSCSIWTVFTNENDQFEYILSFKNPSNGKIISLPKKIADHLIDPEGISVNHEVLHKDLDYPMIIIANIDILEFNENLIEKKKKKESDYLTESNLEMLKILECPVCFEYMVPPIFQCVGGHSLCGECRGKCQQCPSCQKPFGETQNYAVESFTSLLMYPCKHFERGCEFLTSAKEIRKHEKLCKFGSYLCPTFHYTHCKWSGLRHDIWKHCQNNHSDNVMEFLRYSFEFYEEDDEDYFIVKYNKNVFILHYKYVDSQKLFYWALQLVGPPEDSKKYSYDLDIIDRSGQDLRIYMRSICDTLSSKDVAFSADKTYLYLTHKQVKPLINEVFCFKISIHTQKNSDQ